MVDALTRIHAALVPGGVLVDTQPVGSWWPVVVGDEAVGELETGEWVEIVADVDAEIEKALAAGLYELRHEECYRVVHGFDSGGECLDEVKTWGGTQVPAELAARLEHDDSARVTVEHEVRLRLFRRR